MKLDVLGPHPASIGTRFFDHLGGHIDADDVAAWADVSARQETVDAAAGAQVQHRLRSRAIRHRLPEFIKPDLIRWELLVNTLEM